MRTSIAFAAFLAVIACSPSFAQERPVAGSQPAGEGRFRAQQVTTDNPERLLSDWAKPGPGAELRVTNRTVRGRQITSFLVFSGCTKAATGRCDVTADIQVLDASGALSAEKKGVPVSSRPPHPEGNFMLSEGSISIGFDNTDPLGDYRLRAVVTDHVANASITTENVVSLVGE